MFAIPQGGSSGKLGCVDVRMANNHGVIAIRVDAGNQRQLWLFVRKEWVGSAAYALTWPISVSAMCGPRCSATIAGSCWD